MIYNIPNFKVIENETCEENLVENCTLGTDNILPQKIHIRKYDLMIRSISDRKYKCMVLSEFLVGEDFESVYVNQTEGILHVFVYAENEKKAKFKLWKIIKRNDMIEYFKKIEVRDGA